MFTECDVFHLPNCILSQLAGLPLKTTGEKTRALEVKWQGQDHTINYHIPKISSLNSLPGTLPSTAHYFLT